MEFTTTVEWQRETIAPTMQICLLTWLKLLVASLYRLLEKLRF
jgi:hypothetical protein